MVSENFTDAMSLVNTFVDGVQGYQDSDYAKTEDKAGYASDSY